MRRTTGGPAHRTGATGGRSCRRSRVARRRRRARVVSSRETAVKTKNLRRDPRVSLCVMNDGFYGDWIQVDGTATVVSLPDAMEPLVDYYRVVAAGASRLGRLPRRDGTRAAGDRAHHARARRPKRQRVGASFVGCNDRNDGVVRLLRCVVGSPSLGVGRWDLSRCERFREAFCTGMFVIAGVTPKRFRWWFVGCDDHVEAPGTAFGVAVVRLLRSVALRCHVGGARE